MERRGEKKEVAKRRRKGEMERSKTAESNGKKAQDPILRGACVSIARCSCFEGGMMVVKDQEGMIQLPSSEI